jgi:hypothetical protein
LLIIDEELFSAVYDRVRRQGLPEAVVLVIAATHTHSGSGAYGRRFFEKLSMGHFDPAVFERIADAIARAVVRAWERRDVVRMATARAATEGLVESRVEQGGPVDSDVTVTAIYAGSSPEPAAVLVSFAAHPTTLGASNMELSADYPGVVAREIERRFPSATAMFFAGAVADHRPVKSGEGFEPAERLGAALAGRAAALVGGLQPAPVESVSARQERVTLPPARVRVGGITLPRWLGRSLVDDDATLSVVRAGTTVFFGAPCDLAGPLAARLNEAARERGLEPQVIGFASDYIGYCVPASLYDADEYESSMAFNGPDAGEQITDRLIEMMDDE